MKKIISAVLTLLLLSSCFVLTSCQDADGEQTKSPSQGVHENEGEKIPENIPDDLSFNGEEITFLVQSESGGDWVNRDIFFETESDDPVDDAVYKRNLYLEEKYNVKIKAVFHDAPYSAATTSINSMSDEYQVILCNTKESCNLAANRMLKPLNTVGYIDLSQEWWDQTLVKNCSIDGKNYFATGDISVMDNDATWIVMFNKDMVQKYDLESPYDLVAENKWTYDKMYEMMLTVQKDDGNGEVDWDRDTFGLTTHNSNAEALFYGSGATVVSKDDADIPVYDNSAQYKSYISQVLDKSLTIWKDKKLVFAAGRDGHSSIETQEIFQSGRALFLAEVMQLVERLRESEVNFGVIPFPKFSESQKNYGHFVHSVSCMLSIPRTCKESEKVSGLVEAMAAKSMYTLTPAYYDVALKYKGLRDEESADMIDIILKSRTFDLGSLHMFDWGGLGSTFPNQLQAGTNNFASAYERSIRKATTSLNRTLAEFEKDVE